MKSNKLYLTKLHFVKVCYSHLSEEVIYYSSKPSSVFDNSVSADQPAQIPALILRRSDIFNVDSASITWLLICAVVSGPSLSVYRFGSYFRLYVNSKCTAEYTQSNYNSSNIFGTMEICSRHGYFEPLMVNLTARSGGKRDYLGMSFDQL